MSIKIIAKNRKAKFEYFLLETFEAGIELMGSEIKSIRTGQVSLAEAYVRIDGREAWLENCHIATYEHANRNNHEPKRVRKLLLHKKEILKMWNDVRQKGVTVVPVSIYLKNGLAKVEVALARGKKLHDKREVIAKRDAEREMKRKSRIR